MDLLEEREYLCKLYRSYAYVQVHEVIMEHINYYSQFAYEEIGVVKWSRPAIVFQNMPYLRYYYGRITKFIDFACRVKKNFEVGRTYVVRSMEEDQFPRWEKTPFSN